MLVFFKFLLIFLVSLIAPKFFSITEQLQQTPQEPKKFRSILNDSILDYSPFVKLYPPYFETEKGKMSLLRSHFPAQPYWSPLLTGVHHFLLLDLFTILHNLISKCVCHGRSFAVLSICPSLSKTVKKLSSGTLGSLVVEGREDFVQSKVISLA